MSIILRKEESKIQSRSRKEKKKMNYHIKKIKNKLIIKKKISQMENHRRHKTRLNLRKKSKVLQ